MADKKISELDPMVDSLAADDEVPFTDTSASETKKMTLSQLIPAGGDEGDLLRKASGDDLDLEWAAQSIKACSMSYREAYGTGVTLVNSNTLYKVPFTINGDDVNDVTGLSVSGGDITFPVGTFLLSATMIFRGSSDGARRSRLILYNDANGIYGGPNIRNYRDEDGSSVFLNKIIEVNSTDLSFDYSIRFISSGSVYLVDDYDFSSYVSTGNNIAELVITKLA